MNEILELAKVYEMDRRSSQFSMKLSRRIRDNYIYDAFMDGARQKEIANVLNLSESTVKHIIAEGKK